MMRRAGRVPHCMRLENGEEVGGELDIMGGMVAGALRWRRS